MSEYNPYTRGPHSVGTRQFNWTDSEAESQSSC